MLGKTKVPYVTRTSHCRYPAGTSCQAYRVDAGRVLVLEFEDGGIVQLPGDMYHCEGLETRETRKGNHWWQQAMGDLARSIDREVIAELDSISKGFSAKDEEDT